MWIVDRVEHAFTCDGQVVYPGDVERCIGEHTAVRDVGVVGVDGSGRAFVVLDDGSDASATDIIEHCRTQLDPRAVPASVAFVDALPRTSVGKLDRPRCSSARSPHRESLTASRARPGLADPLCRCNPAGNWWRPVGACGGARRGRSCCGQVFLVATAQDPAPLGRAETRRRGHRGAPPLATGRPALFAIAPDARWRIDRPSSLTGSDQGGTNDCGQGMRWLSRREHHLSSSRCVESRRSAWLRS